MAFTARLPEKLQQEAQDCAARLGISLNALLAVALRDYLDAHPVRFSASSDVPLDALDSELDGPVSVKPPQKLTHANLQEFIARKVYVPKNVDPRLSPDLDDIPVIPRKVQRSPCWCGSGKELRRCHRRLKLATD